MAVREKLIKALRDGSGFTIRDAVFCVNTLVDLMAETLAAGESIELRGFGTFWVKRTAERKMSLNKTDGIVPAHGRIYFKPCEKLRRAAMGAGPKK